MHFHEYQQLALRTESPVTPDVEDRFIRSGQLVIHCLQGLYDHNITDQIKKYIFYGKPIKDMAIREMVDRGRAESPKIARMLLEENFDKVALIRLCHALLGIRSELGEVVDALFLGTLPEGQTLRDNVMEESLDITWYTALGLDAMDICMDAAAQANILKLSRRYEQKHGQPLQFSAEKANNRDLTAENAALKSVSST